MQKGQFRWMFHAIMMLSFPTVEAGSHDNSFSIDGQSSVPSTSTTSFGRISKDEYILSPEQIECFHRDGCVTIPDVLYDEEVEDLTNVFDKFIAGEIEIPKKDFCDMSKKWDPSRSYEDWSLVNCMLPSRYHPPLVGNIYERLTASMARQLFPTSSTGMTNDYDQFLNKKPGKSDAIFAWHQDMAYWPGQKALGGLKSTDTCTFSLALDDSLPENGCLKFVVGSGRDKSLRKHIPAVGDSREEGHALTTTVHSSEPIRLAPAKRGSLTIHDEYVVHGSGGNHCQDRQRRTYVIAYRAREIVEAERKIGFTHSHNDEVNWDTFEDGEIHRLKSD